MGLLGTLRLRTDGWAGGSAMIAPTATAAISAALSLALDPPACDGLADGNACEASVACGQRSADGARVVDGAADIATGVDPGDDQVERVAEEAEAGVDDAQPRWSAHRPGQVDAVDPGVMDLGADQVQGAERGTGAGVLLIGCHDRDVPVFAHRPGKDVQAYRVDAVVVGDQYPHVGDGTGSVET